MKHITVASLGSHRYFPNPDESPSVGCAMRTFSEPVSDDARKFARNIVEMPEPELSDLIHRLRWHRRLTSTVHALNVLTRNPPDVELGKRALRRLGLERCG